MTAPTASHTVPTASDVSSIAQDATKGQSDVDRAKNFAATASALGEKILQHPSEVTAQDANALKSAEAKHTGIRNPPADSVSAAAARLAAANEKAARLGKEAGAALEKADE
ncbi:hypothetical protein K461DRAFT_298406 [Myriangium duriaei CBS 260.36]|uniref:SMP domain-containing protein n=1 Tax=Myriangium duriaei CBS 260.36 TaxID=1168546 RepID=A0A9P4MHE4_9PEZI|nr:hypothetical protein K461DRAFT_298406 [Myriangium duriaei CBS 260.36]